jgi:hypothetical protein
MRQMIAQTKVALFDSFRFVLNSQTNIGADVSANRTDFSKATMRMLCDVFAIT